MPVAALQLTNLYKRGRQSAERAYLVGYARALRDILSRIPAPETLRSQDDGAAQLRRLREYLARRVEAVRSDTQEHDDLATRVPGAPASTGRPAPVRRRAAERRMDSRASHPKAAPAQPDAARRSDEDMAHSSANDSDSESVRGTGAHDAGTSPRMSAAHTASLASPTPRRPPRKRRREQRPSRPTTP